MTWVRRGAIQVWRDEGKGHWCRDRRRVPCVRPTGHNGPCVALVVIPKGYLP